MISTPKNLLVLSNGRMIQPITIIFHNHHAPPFPTKHQQEKIQASALELELEELRNHLVDAQQAAPPFILVDSD